MKQKPLLKEDPEEKQEKPVWVPKVVQGGKEPPGPHDPSGPDWLRELSNHTTFLAQSKQDTSFPLALFTIAGKTEKAVFLHLDGKQKSIPVDPIRFCRDFRLFEVLETGEEYDRAVEANEKLREQDMAEGNHPFRSEPEKVDEDVPF